MQVELGTRNKGRTPAEVVAETTHLETMRPIVEPGTGLTAEGVPPQTLAWSEPQRSRPTSVTAPTTLAGSPRRA